MNSYPKTKENGTGKSKIYFGQFLTNGLVSFFSSKKISLTFRSKTVCPFLRSTDKFFFRKSISILTKLKREREGLGRTTNKKEGNWPVTTWNDEKNEQTRFNAKRYGKIQIFKVTNGKICGLFVRVAPVARASHQSTTTPFWFSRVSLTWVFLPFFSFARPRLTKLVLRGKEGDSSFGEDEKTSLTKRKTIESPHPLPLTSCFSFREVFFVEPIVLPCKVGRKLSVRASVICRRTRSVPGVELKVA